MVSKREEINRLFKGGEEIIPPEILEPVRNFFFAVQGAYGLDHETYRDIVQISLIKIWRLKGSFEIMPPEYFVGVAKHTIENSCRERSRSATNNAKLKEINSINEKEMMNDVLRQRYSKGDFDGLIRRVLTDKEAAVVFRKCYEDRTLPQISVDLELSLETVKNRYYRAIQKLRDHLRPVVSEEEEEEENVELNQ